MNKHPDVTELGLPCVEALGRDLLQTTPTQRWLAVARPFIGLLVYIGAVSLGWWVLTPLIVFLIFVSVVTVTHDVVHGSLGFHKRYADVVLLLMGAVLMESGHAYRITHHQHHTHFPADNDPEGYPAKIGLLGAVIYGPVFLVRLWIWAFVQRPNQRLWLVVEAFVPVSVILIGITQWPNHPAILIYAGLAIVGSWVYPLLTVYLPHKDYGDNPLTQTHPLRGRLIPALFLELTYHLEHHLYPQVPGHNLAKLAQRLDPHFERLGVQVWHVI